MGIAYDAYFSVQIFWVTLGRKMGVAAMHAPNGPGLRTRHDRQVGPLQLGGPFGLTAISKSCFQNWEA